MYNKTKWNTFSSFCRCRIQDITKTIFITHPLTGSEGGTNSNKSFGHTVVPGCPRSALRIGF